MTDITAKRCDLLDLATRRRRDRLDTIFAEVHPLRPRNRFEWAWLAVVVVIPTVFGIATGSAAAGLTIFSVLSVMGTAPVAARRSDEWHARLLASDLEWDRDVRGLWAIRS